ncbi:hypothetical protein PsorP6_008451 [Peronosclerospora sorghi]|uniref:Uncharacterized protein n=1 Tax=Peronosclerospora sorghi TaxID=230839 RepID=A0ACC0W8V7_9STRA|nr:hypothetical protein PsorP6_008451 [Peronosclerospora sorghi]
MTSSFNRCLSLQIVLRKVTVVNGISSPFADCACSALSLSRIEAPQPIEEEESDTHEQPSDGTVCISYLIDGSIRIGTDVCRGSEPRRGAYHHDHEDNRRGDHRMNNREPREEHVKNPVPDVGPWKVRLFCRERRTSYRTEACDVLLKLYVGNLSFRLTENDLAAFIGPEGINDIRFPRDQDNRPKGFAYVEFDDRELLIQALELDGRKIDGRHIKMDVAVDRDRRSRDNGRFEKRNNRPPNDRTSENNDRRRERPRLSLLPRTTSSEKQSSATNKPSIFGDAKPRDEIAYQERKKTLELERKAKAKEAQEKEAENAKEAKEAKTRAEAATVSRRGSRSDAVRGGRGDRRSVDGGRGRGTTLKSDVPARKSQPRPKRAEAPKSRNSVPTSAKPANAYELLNDSDSESE